jgi:hypothetical protein
LQQQEKQVGKTLGMYSSIERVGLDRRAHFDRVPTAAQQRHLGEVLEGPRVARFVFPVLYAEAEDLEAGGKGARRDDRNLVWLYHRLMYIEEL